MRSEHIEVRYSADDGVVSVRVRAVVPRDAGFDGVRVELEPPTDQLERPTDRGARRGT